jgi:RIO-like serine/threonine protein kinase
MRTNGNDESIAPECSSPSETEQRGDGVQWRNLSAIDKRILAALDGRDEFVSAKALAEKARVSVWTARSRLDKLVGDSLVERQTGARGGYRKVAK